VSASVVPVFDRQFSQLCHFCPFFHLFLETKRANVIEIVNANDDDVVNENENANAIAIANVNGDDAVNENASESAILNDDDAVNENASASANANTNDDGICHCALV
jgi:uncharacterized protein YbcV (DUF1398 family)